MIQKQENQNKIKKRFHIIFEIQYYNHRNRFSKWIVIHQMDSVSLAKTDR